MPIDYCYLRECKCCGKKSVCIDLIYLCSKCTVAGHDGFPACIKCKELKESNEKKPE